MTSNIINMASAKKAIEDENKFIEAMRDIDLYEKVVQGSVESFHTHSVQEKYALYSSLANFNVELLKIIHGKKESEVE